MSEVEVRIFTKDDMQQLGVLYHAVTSNNDDTVFWWVGEEENWPNVFVAIESGQIIGKGQVGVISTIPPGSPQEHAHYIYFNLKTLPQREDDYPLYDLLYKCLLNRAYELKESLPSSNRTMIAVGNQSTEEYNNNYFESKGFVYWKSSYTMRSDLSEKIEESVLVAPYRCLQETLDSDKSIDEYLEMDMEIWPEAPIGFKQLKDHQNNSLWTAFVIRENTTLVGSVMAWVDEDGEGIIEDLFVRDHWRKQGIAQHLLSRALTYLKDHGCAFAELQVEAANNSALSLYHSVGFKEVSKEVRYHREL
ncbi:GNAT family N-acetyltransferase [Paenibacillus sp. GSMTC-2017]|uniref:GNAT family N-acetyltransferase n=1 Tax=Paenibacillus sp. GSMTC-2017 TaxID=2794350 RepID=UPI0018D5B786|nr:GNAT family N-acetyltransferase [Paenibacillus sp. GSMTC-2017]MBH5319381.1 GNAT family N-acetyltransferase [Paenibacillus sp. GSMTC-2017]